jgi:hypothetical protein
MGVAHVLQFRRVRETLSRSRAGPETIAIYCLLSTSNVIGGAENPEPTLILHSSSRVQFMAPVSEFQEITLSSSTSGVATVNSFAGAAAERHCVSKLRIILVLGQQIVHFSPFF